jgi:hypothetical protein
MNLLLYTESKYALARLVGEQPPAGLTGLWHGDDFPCLPDALFEELGYFSALDEDESDEEEYEELFRWLAAEPVSL